MGKKRKRSQAPSVGSVLKRIKQEEVHDIYALPPLSYVNGEDLPKDMRKYLQQRYRYFSGYDNGILMDKEGWFSVTPEAIAERIAWRMLWPYEYGGQDFNPLIVLDPFAGVGGNVIQFARAKDDILVIASDSSLNRLRLAKHNAGVYGVSDHIDFIHADVSDMSRWWRGPKQDTAVFLSPPWGGVEYKEEFDFERMGNDINGPKLYKNILENISENITFYLPRTIDPMEIARELGGAHPLRNVEIEYAYLSGKCKAMIAYVGNLAKNVKNGAHQWQEDDITLISAQAVEMEDAGS